VRGIEFQQESFASADADQLIASSWPLWDQAYHFELGHIINSAIVDAISPPPTGALGNHHAGLWECDLADGKLTWSGGVYDIFGLERNSPISRNEALGHYTEDSRARLERIRAEAIRLKRGFTLDVDVKAATIGQIRRVRLIGAPVLAGELPVRLHGVKILI
jgi:PAS domain-containing protein